MPNILKPEYTKEHSLYLSSLVRAFRDHDMNLKIGCDPDMEHTYIVYNTNTLSNHDIDKIFSKCVSVSYTSSVLSQDKSLNTLKFEIMKKSDLYAF